MINEIDVWLEESVSRETYAPTAKFRYVAGLVLERYSRWTLTGEHETRLGALSELADVIALLSTHVENSIGALEGKETE